eukprot:6135842-Amphidinium_carterae.1
MSSSCSMATLQSESNNRTTIQNTKLASCTLRASCMQQMKRNIECHKRWMVQHPDSALAIHDKTQIPFQYEPAPHL